MQQKDRQELSPAGAGDRYGLAVMPDLERSEDAELHLAGDSSSGRYLAVTAAPRARRRLSPTRRLEGGDRKEEQVMQVKRTLVAALVIAVAAAPAAPARVAMEPGTTAVKQHRVEAPRDNSRFAEMAVLRNALRERQLQQAEHAPVNALVRADGDGFDWTSAAIGATASLALLVLALLARPAVSRRRSRLAGVAS
jgi:hypothetical protein